MALSTAAREIATIARRHRLTYSTFNKAVHQVRQHLKLRPDSGHGRKLPKLLTDTQLTDFFNVIDKADNLKHQLMLRLLFFTGIRVSELTGIKISDVDFNSGRIYIEQGKGAKDRYVLFPESFGLTLKAYIRSVEHTGQVYLFESKHKRPYSERQVQRLAKEYGEAAGIAGVHPHKFRHQLLTHLTKQGLTDSQIQLISGHASKESLAVYQHLGLQDVKDDYEQAMRKVEL